MDGRDYVLRQDDLQFLRRILRNVVLPSLRLGDDAEEPAIKEASERCERLAVVLSEVADGMCHDDAIIARDGITNLVHGV